MTILVTGGAGFIGSHLIQALHAAGHTIVNVDEVNDYYNVEFKTYNLSLLQAYSDYTFYKRDINDLEGIRAIFEHHRPDTVIHLGARAGVRSSMQEPELYKVVNYGGTKRLNELANSYGVKQFIFGSTSAVYGNSVPPFSEELQNLNPISKYAEYKLLAEDWLHTNHQATGLPTTILRFFTVYGERGRPDMAPYLFTDAVLRGQPIQKFGDGTTSRDYTYINDIVAGIVSAVEHPLNFEIINLGNNQAVSLNTFIATLEQVTGKSAVIVPAQLQPGDVNHTLADISKAQRLLGYAPTTSLQQGLEKFVQWYQHNRI